MDNGTIVLEILRNLSNDDIYTLIDVFENHNNDEEYMKEFDKVVNKIQNIVNKLDSNFLTNFKDKVQLAYFIYDTAMDYHSNDLTQEKINKYLNFYKNTKTESTNKYVKAFKEACKKLEEVSVGKELTFSKADGDYGAYYDSYTDETVIYKITKDVLQRVPGELNRDKILDYLYKLGK